MDGSDSIVEEDFASVKQWILHVVDAFEPWELSDELGVYVVQYSDNAVIEINAMIANSSDEIKGNVSSIEQMNSGTKTYTALKFVNTEVHPSLRSASFKILITLTDGRARDGKNALTVNKARDNFNKMMVVGIGDNTDREELLDFSSTGQVVKISNFEELNTFVMQVVDDICSGI